ncbi:a-factor receptor [Salix suchowensis]|nr:a-factor receptor [Salix suchowensis]
MVDLAIGLGIPILGMILQYIPQGHRFNVFEDLGCYPFTYNTPVAFVLVYCPPVLIGCISGYYCIRSILAFNKRRLQFKELLSANSGRLTSNRYFRLMGLACTDVVLTVPLGLYAISLNARIGSLPGWAGLIPITIPGVLWRMDKTFVTAVELSRWSIVSCAFVFFFFFGFADEARKHYRIAFDSVAKRVGYTTGGTMSSTGTFNEKRSYPGMGSTGTGVTLPVFVHTDMITKRESYASFSDMSFMDAGGALDVKTDVGYSTSASSSTLSVPEQAHTRQDVVGIEISSVRGCARLPSPPPSESSVNKENPPRHTPIHLNI